MIHLFTSAAAKIWKITAVLVIVLAVFVVATRLSLLWLPEFKSQLEALVSKRTGLGLIVSLGDISADLVRTVLVVKNMTFTDPEDQSAQLSFEEVQLDFDVIGSLISGRLQVEGASVIGTRLELKRLPDGTLTMTGIKGIRDTGIGAEGYGWFFLAVDELRLLDSEVIWEDQKKGAAPLRFSEVDLEFRNEGGHHLVNAHVRLPDSGDAWFRVAADFEGDPERPESFVGEAYVKGEDLALGHLLGVYDVKGYRIESGVVDMELWGHLHQGGLAGLVGTVGVDQLKLVSEQEQQSAQTFAVRELEARLKWQRLQGGWQLDVPDLALTGDQGAWPRSRFGLRFSDVSGAGHRMQGGFDFLRMQDLLPITGLLLKQGSGIIQALQATRPRGDLHELRFIYEELAGAVTWSARGRVDGFHNEAWNRLPGVSGAAAAVWASHQGGAVEIHSPDHVSVHLPRLFRKPLRADKLSGRVNWHWQPGGGLVADTPELIARNADISTRTRMRLELPGDGGSPFLDLQTDFREGRASAVPTYLPVGIMKEKLVAWLDRAFVSGEIHSGSALLRGPLADFPFKQDQGQLEVLFSMDDLILDYRERWPRLEEAVVELLIVNNSLNFRLAEGKLLESKVVGGEGNIEQMVGASPLRLHAELTGPFSDGLRVLSETPLSQKLGQLADHLQVNGPAETTLDLQLPFKKPDPVKVAGGAVLKNAGLRLRKLDITLHELNGKLEFSETGVWCKGLKAEVFNIPITLDLDTLAAEQRKFTRVSARGGVGVKELKGRFPANGLDHLRGSARARLDVDIPHQGGRLPVRMEVDLTDVAVAAPPPLGKVQGEERKLQLRADVSDQPITQVEAQYGKELSAALVLSGEVADRLVLERGVIRFGNRRAQPRMDEGLWLEGDLEALDLDAWVKWGKRNAAGNSAVLAEKGSLKGVDVGIGRLLVGGHTLRDLMLNVQRTEAAWTGTIGSDLLAGNIYFPHDAAVGPLVMKLKYLALSLSDKLGETGPIDAGAQPVATEIFGNDPTKLPGFDVRADELRVNDKALGRLEFRTQRIPSGQHMTKLSVKGTNLDLSSNGHWVIRGEGQETDLSLAVKIEKMGDLIRDLGFSSAIEYGPTQWDAVLQWPAPPSGFALDRVQGTVSVDIGQGRLLDVKPGVGRVFGLLNLGALQRRLSLDFTDLFGKGFSFDKIKGTFILRDGDAVTEDAFLEGPSARIDISGRAGLVARDYDQEMVVTPRVSVGIPLAGALAGGPVVGAALLVAQQIFGKKVDKITSARYTVNGGWDDPVITRKPRTVRKQNEKQELNTDFLDQ